MNHSYENLANAIIIQAADDYRAALRKLKRKPRNQDAKDRATDCERFFRSQWYEALTSVDGEYLIKKLRGEIMSR